MVELTYTSSTDMSSTNGISYFDNEVDDDLGTLTKEELDELNEVIDDPDVSNSIIKKCDLCMIF